MLLSCLLVFGVCTSGCYRTKEVKVPAPIPMCRIPPFHVQAECNDDVECLLTEFALTLQAEAAVEKAFAPCAHMIDFMDKSELL